MAPRCRPPYEERSARISILANGIAARPDTSAVAQALAWRLTGAYDDGDLVLESTASTFAPSSGKTVARGDCLISGGKIVGECVAFEADMRTSVKAA
jgi:hypothetical protein